MSDLSAAVVNRGAAHGHQADTIFARNSDIERFVHSREMLPRYLHIHKIAAPIDNDDSQLHTRVLNPGVYVLHHSKLPLMLKITDQAD